MNNICFYKFYNKRDNLFNAQICQLYFSLVDGFGHCYMMRCDISLCHKVMKTSAKVQHNIYKRGKRMLVVKQKNTSLEMCLKANSRATNGNCYGSCVGIR